MLLLKCFEVNAKVTHLLPRRLIPHPHGDKTNISDQLFPRDLDLRSATHRLRLELRPRSPLHSYPGTGRARDAIQSLRTGGQSQLKWQHLPSERTWGFLAGGGASVIRDPTIAQDPQIFGGRLSQETTTCRKFER